MILENDINVTEARKALWKEFDTVSDETIEMMFLSFKLIARQIIEDLENEEEWI